MTELKLDERGDFDKNDEFYPHITQMYKNWKSNEESIEMLVNKLVSNIGCEEIAIYYTNLIGCIMSKGQSDIYKQNGKGIMDIFRRASSTLMEIRCTFLESINSKMPHDINEMDVDLQILKLVIGELSKEYKKYNENIESNYSKMVHMKEFIRLASKQEKEDLRINITRKLSSKSLLKQI